MPGTGTEIAASAAARHCEDGGRGARRQSAVGNRDAVDEHARHVQVHEVIADGAGDAKITSVIADAAARIICGSPFVLVSATHGTPAGDDEEDGHERIEAISRTNFGTARHTSDDPIPPLMVARTLSRKRPCDAVSTRPIATATAPMVPNSEPRRRTASS